MRTDAHNEIHGGLQLKLSAVDFAYIYASKIPGICQHSGRLALRCSISADGFRFVSAAELRSILRARLVETHATVPPLWAIEEVMKQELETHLFPEVMLGRTQHAGELLRQAVEALAPIHPTTSQLLVHQPELVGEAMRFLRKPVRTRYIGLALRDYGTLFGLEAYGPHGRSKQWCVAEQRAEVERLRAEERKAHGHLRLVK